MQLSFGQRIKRRLMLTFRSHYRHPDGLLELDFEEKAGIDPRRDSEELQDAKLNSYNLREAVRSNWWQGFVAGTLFGALIVKYWPW
jgi:hypothetical protein